MDRLTTEDVVKLARSPLGIVALFVLLIDSVVVTGIVNTTGSIQFWLTMFVMGFTGLFGLGFFLIWWNKPHALYPPWEYGSETRVSEYANAMQGKNRETSGGNDPEKHAGVSTSKVPPAQVTEEKGPLGLKVPPPNRNYKGK